MPYNRNFNFINGERSIGKTYSILKFLISKALKKGNEFIYIVRTQDEKKRGIFESAFEKVIEKEFHNQNIVFDKETCYLEIAENDKQILGYCIALSEAIKIKKRSFPNVKYMYFDEYMIEQENSNAYVNGWNEPDLLLSIYHTVDREQDKVICFLTGNNTSFYNPYHLHAAFKIPYIEKGHIWYSENVLFQWATATTELTEAKQQSRFIKMLASSQYGKYAVNGDYKDDNSDFIQQRPALTKHVFAFIHNDFTFGVWVSKKDNIIFISDKYDTSSNYIYALTVNSHNEKTVLDKSTLIKWLSKNYKIGNVRFETMEIKKMCETALQIIVRF